MSRAVADALAAALADADDDGRPVRDLLAAVRAAGGGQVSRAAVERALATDPRFVVDDADPRRPRWRLDPDAGDDLAPGGPAGAAPVGSGRAPATTSARGSARRPGEPGDPPRRPAAGASDLAALELRDWQVEALAAWSQAGCRGVVEAVTGTGKTRLAIAAVRGVLGATGAGADGARALVIAPTLELQDQWVRELRTALPDARIGRLGGGHDDDLFAHHVVVATPHSAAAVPVDLPPGAVGLLVADEAHRYGAPTWGAALRDTFALRLAVTATFERNDEGVEDVLLPYFGEVVLRYRFDRAVAEGTIAPFRIATVGVHLDDDERQRYDQADRRVRQLHRELVGVHGMSRDPRRRFAAVTAIVAESDRTGRGGPQVLACREYLARVRERRDVAAQARGKLAVCRAVAGGLAGRRSLVFTDTVDQAEAAAARLVAAGRTAETVHGDLPGDRRRIRLASFRRGDLEVLVAPRVLDEGVDVPAADVAVVLAAFRTRRQMVQRLGRVLRVKPDGGAATLVLAHAIDTAEDPANGGHAAFLDEVTEVAREVRELELPTGSDELAQLLVNGGR